MPIKDDAARRSYCRDYIRERRAGQREKSGLNRPDAEVDPLREQLRALENELENAKRATAMAAEEVALTLELHAAEKRITTLQARVTRAEQAAKEAATKADTELQRKFAEARSNRLRYLIAIQSRLTGAGGLHSSTSAMSPVAIKFGFAPKCCDGALPDSRTAANRLAAGARGRDDLLARTCVGSLGLSFRKRQSNAKHRATTGLVLCC